MLSLNSSSHTAVSHDLLAELSDLVASYLGLDFSRERWQDLERAVMTSAQQRETDPEGFLETLLFHRNIPQIIDILVPHLTVNETYFLREETTFSILKNKIFPEFINRRRQKYPFLRIWSAGCSSGEEPYTIAILLKELIPDISNWHISIIATDVNPVVLQKASRGIYTQWSFRRTPEWFRSKYFRSLSNKQFEILPEIKEMVQFHLLNLVDSSSPESHPAMDGMDIIFCRNVLMYFNEQSRQEVLKKFSSHLADGGWLTLGAAETFPVRIPQLAAENFSGAVFYRKTTAVAEQTVLPDLTGRLRSPDSSPVVAAANSREKSMFQTGQTPVPVKNKALQTSLPSINKRLSKARAFYRAARYRETIDLLAPVCRAALQKDERFLEAMRFLAKSFANIGKTDEAIYWCEQILTYNKLDYRTYHLLSAILLERRQYNQAAAALTKALYLEPEFIVAHVAMGNISYQTKNLYESQRYLQNALSLLSKMSDETEVPETEGMNARHLKIIISEMLQKIGDVK